VTAAVRTYRPDDFEALRDLINAGGGPRVMTDTALREFLDYP